MALAASGMSKSVASVVDEAIGNLHPPEPKPAICAGPARWMCTVPGLGHVCFDCTHQAVIGGACTDCGYVAERRR